MPTTLVTIPFSHYCEKARWALERARIDFVEDGHLPIFSYLPLAKLRRRRTVPALITARGDVLSDSTDIVRWCDLQAPACPLFPADLPDVVELEEEFDRRLGPATRRLAYFHLLGSDVAMTDMVGDRVPAWERRVGAVMRPAMEALIRRGLKVDAAGATRSQTALDQVFAAVSERLADGRRYLCGDRFTAADLTFASLAAPLLAPEPFASEYLPAVNRLPAAFLEVRDRYRATPAGQLGLRLYADDRAAPR